MLLRLIDRLSLALAAIAMAEVVILILAMCWEVVSRYGFNQPTVWSVDISLMLNGTMFLLAAGYTLLRNAHVRIDVLSTRLPLRAQHAINAVVLLLAVIPCLGWISWVAVGKAVTAYARNEKELSSAWGPIVWPLYAGIALGLVGLTLQSVAQCIRHLLCLGDPARPSPLAGQS